MPATNHTALARVATGACLLALGCQTPGPSDESVLESPYQLTATGTYECICDAGHYCIELSADGAFRFFVCADGRRQAAVWGCWFVNGGSLGGIGVRLMPNVPGVEPWSRWVLSLWATPDHRPTELLFDWVHDRSDWAAFQPGRRVRFVRMAD